MSFAHSLSIVFKNKVRMTKEMNPERSFSSYRLVIKVKIIFSFFNLRAFVCVWIVSKLRFISYFSRLNDVFFNLKYLLFINILHSVAFMPLLLFVPMPGMHLFCPAPPCRSLQFQAPSLFQSSLKCYLLQEYCKVSHNPSFSIWTPTAFFLQLSKMTFISLYIMSQLSINI